MADVYSQTFEMRRSAAAAFPAQFAAMLKQWLRDRWPRDHAGLDVERTETFKSEDGSIFRWEPYRPAGGYFADFVLRHNDRNAPDVSWSTRVTLIQTNTITVHVRISNTCTDLRDPRFHTTRPRLALLLAQAGGCFCDGQLMDMRPTRLDAQAVQDLAAYVVLDPDRPHPVLVLTPRQDGTFVEDPEKVAEEFASLGQLAVAAEPAATFALTEEVGRRELSCFHGALRVYLPGFTRASDPLKHPLLLPRALSDRTTRLALGRALARYTPKRYCDDPMINTIRDERAVSYQNEIAAQLSAMRIAASDSVDLSVWRELAEDLEKKNTALIQENSDLRERARTAEATANSLKYQLARRTAGAEVEDESDADSGLSAQSVEDAVELAAEYYPDELIILESAFESARDSDFMRPNDALRALQAMATIARKFKEEGPGTPLDKAFEDHGQDYRGGVAKSTSKKQGQQYEFMHEGQLVSCREHLCFGVKQDPKKCLRIYFSSSRLSEGKFIVGHVGRHFDTKRTS